MKIRTTNKKLVIGVFAVLIAFSMIATAGLLAYYGKVETTANVQQSVVLWDTKANDWKEDNTAVSEDFNVTGGCCECSAQSIWNRAEVEAPIDIQESINAYGKGPEGVDVDIFIFNDFTDTRDQEHVWGTGLVDLTGELEVSVEYGCETTTFTATAPSDYAWDDLMTFAFDMNCDGTADFQIQWDDEWKYKETNNAGDDWEDFEDVPEQYILTKDGRTHTLTLPTSELGTTYKFGVDSNGLASELGQTFYSNDAEHLWYNGDHYASSDCYVQHTVKTDVPDTFTLQPGEQLDFIIQYCFDIAIICSSNQCNMSSNPPGTYDITTTFVPGTD